MADDIDPDVVYDPERNVMHRLKYQFIFYPRASTRLLTGEIESRLFALFREACEMNVWQLHEIEIEPTEVHLLLQLPDTCSIDEAVNALQGRTSRLLRAQFPDLEEWSSGENFWDEEYSVESVGEFNEASIEEFLRLSHEQHERDDPDYSK